MLSKMVLTKSLTN